MKLVLLDWETMEYKSEIKFCPPVGIDDFDIFGHTDPEQIIERVGDAEFLICNKTPITRAVIEACPNLKYIGLLATGYNNIDIECAKERGICVCNAGTYSTNAVAQLVFAYITMHHTRLDIYKSDVRLGKWETAPTFSYFPHPIQEISGKTLGIFGFGNIGRKVAEIAHAFGMNILVCTRTPKEDIPYPQVDLETLLRQSDIITLHCPLNDGTKNLICKTTLSMVKPSAILINTARGGVVDEDALAQALNENRLAAAYLDVLQKEPMDPNTPLKQAKNCVITPHIAWASLQTRQRLLHIVQDNIAAYIKGTPQNRIC